MGKQTSPVKNILPGLQDIIFISIFCAAILLGPRMLNMDGDLPKHLAIGKYVLQGNPPPLYDIFSYTKYGTPFAPHKWLSGLLFYISYILFAEKGIVILSGVLLAATFTLIYTDGVARTNLRLSTFLLVVWGAAVSSLHWISRPHLFTMLMLAIWLIWNERLASGNKIPLWYFPVGMLLWNNMHGEFISGFLVTFACVAGWIWEYIFNRTETSLETGKRLGLVLVMIVLVTILNPVSFRALATVTNWMGNEYLMSHTQETVPPDFLNSDFLILLLLIAFSIFLLAMNREKVPTRQAFILAGFSALVLLSARNVHIYGVVAPFVLASTFGGSQNVPLVKWFESLFSKFENKLNGIVWPGIVILIGIVLLAVSPLGSLQQFAPNYFPVGAVEWLKDHPQDGEMFNPFDWGGYINLMLWPENQIFIDSQGDVYGEAFIREYEQIITLREGWQNVLNKYNVDWALVPRSWPLAKAMTDEDWYEVYADGTTIILRRGE